MVKNDIIISKLSRIDEYLIKLENYLPVSYDELKNDWGLQKIIERSLQFMVEVMIDIAERIIARKGGAPPVTSADAISRLKDLGVVQNVDTYTQMVRFRNLLVHNYDTLDIKILHSIITERLDDFKKFKKEIIRYENI